MAQVQSTRRVQIVLNDAEAKLVHYVLHLAKSSNIPNIHVLTELRELLDDIYGKPKKKQAVPADEPTEEEPGNQSDDEVEQ